MLLIRSLALLPFLLLLALPASAAPPNILFVLTDDMRRDDLEYMPKVRALVGDAGITFDSFIVNVSLCCPSRASILRGQYSHNTQVLANTAPGGGYEKAVARGLERATIATALHDAGYATGFFGKYLNGYPGRSPYGWDVPDGWETWRVPVGGEPYSGYDYVLADEIELNGTVYRWATSHGRTSADYITDVLRDEAREFIARTATEGRPFFAWLGSYAPQAPPGGARRHAGLFPDLGIPRGIAFGEDDVRDKPRYISRLQPLRARLVKKLTAQHRRRVLSLQAVDEAVAALIADLEADGRLANTYVFFSSDNGFHLGEHRLRQGKQAPYEEDIGVPFVVRGPGVPAGRTVKAIGMNIDIAPTFAELAGTALAYEPDGRSLVPWLHDPDGEHERRRAALLDLWPRSAGREDKTKVPSFHGVRTERHLFVEYKTGERELYDLATDPAQLENAIDGAPPDLVRALEERVRNLRGCAGVACRLVENLALPVPRSGAEPPKKPADVVD
jgi:arylsulfatase A-like enzyme